jgi:hypothetical protein
MDERGEPGTQRTHDEAPVLSPLQQAHQDSYEQTRERVRRLQATAAAKRQTKDFGAALKLMFEGADQMCAEAENLPARMDEEAQDRSRRLVRSAGAGDVVLAVVLLTLVAFGVLGRGWLLGVLLLAGASAGLLMEAIAPAGGAHQAQRVPALASPALGAIGLLMAALTSWWFVSFLFLVFAAFAAVAAMSQAGSLATEGSR